MSDKKQNPPHVGHGQEFSGGDYIPEELKWLKPTELFEHLERQKHKAPKEEPQPEKPKSKPAKN